LNGLKNAEMTAPLKKLIESSLLFNTQL
jgi:hypothetical protein